MAGERWTNLNPVTTGPRYGRSLGKAQPGQAPPSGCSEDMSSAKWVRKPRLKRRGVKNTGWQASIFTKPEKNKHVTERSQSVMQSIPRGRTLISAWGIPGPGGKQWETWDRT